MISLLLLNCGGIARPDGYRNDPSLLHQALDAQEQHLKPIQGELKATLWRGDERIRGRQLFALSPPNRLRLTLLSPFEQPLSDLIYREDKIMLWLMKENRFLHGPASPEALARLTGLKLPPPLFMGALHGRIPRIQREGGEVSWDHENGRYLLLLQKDKLRQEFSLSADRLTPERVEMWRDGHLLYRFSLGKYQSGFPRRIRVEHPKEGLRLDLAVVELEQVETLPEQVFEMKAPSGVKVESF